MFGPASLAPTSSASSRISSVSACRGLDREVHHDLRAERLAQLEPPDAGAGRPGRPEASAASSRSSGRMPEDHLLAGVGRERGPVLERLLARARSSARRPCARATPFCRLDRRLEHVHRRAADEAADEEVDRAVVQRLRIVDLLQLALAHDGDAVAHRHRLDLVVRDVDGRDAEIRLELRDLGAHLHAQLRVEVRERLVHQERRTARGRSRGPSRPAAAGRRRARAACASGNRIEAEHARRVA